MVGLAAVSSVVVQGPEGRPGQGRFPGVGISKRPLHTKVVRRRRMMVGPMVEGRSHNNLPLKLSKLRVAISDTESELLKGVIFNQTSDTGGFLGDAITCAVHQHRSVSWSMKVCNILVRSGQNYFVRAEFSKA